MSFFLIEEFLKTLTESTIDNRRLAYDRSYVSIVFADSLGKIFFNSLWQSITSTHNIDIPLQALLVSAAKDTLSKIRFSFESKKRKVNGDPMEVFEPKELSRNQINQLIGNYLQNLLNKNLVEVYVNILLQYHHQSLLQTLCANNGPPTTIIDNLLPTQFTNTLKQQNDANFVGRQIKNNKINQSNQSNQYIQIQPQSQPDNSLNIQIQPVTVDKQSVTVDKQTTDQLIDGVDFSNLDVTFNFDGV